MGKVSGHPVTEKPEIHIIPIRVQDRPLFDPTRDRRELSLRESLEQNSTA